MNMRTLLPSILDDRTSSFDGLRKEVEKLFDDFSRFRLPDVSAGLVPDMDMHETDKEVTLSLELPGVDEKDIDISVSGQSIAISGEKKAEKETKDGGVHRSERSYGSFSRSVSLPFRIDGDKVEATFARGVLTVTVPKPAEAVEQTRKVQIKS